MRYFNEDKTIELDYGNLDLETGHLEPSTLTHHVQAVAGQEAKGYFDQTQGGVYVQTQPYIETVAEHDETEEIMLYIPYSTEELSRIEAQRMRLATMEALKAQMAEKEDYLKSTDYMAIKCAERGLSMQTEYPNEYIARQNARDGINDSRTQLAQLEGQEA